MYLFQKRQKLVNIMCKVQQFLARVTQLSGYEKLIYHNANLIEETEFTNELSTVIQLLQLVIVSTTSGTVCAGIEAASKVEISFIKEVTNIYNEIVEIC